MPFDFDITYKDFNPTVFYVSKGEMVDDGVYHEHDFAEIAYVLSGKGKYIIDGVEYDVQTGDLIFCNPGVKHTHIVVDPNNPTTEFISGFTDFQFKDMPANSLVTKDGSYIIRTSADLKQEIIIHSNAMITEKESGKPGKYFMFKTHLMQLLLLLFREVSEVKDNEQKGFNFETYNKSYAVNRIIHYLNENYSKKISLDNIAENMYLSPVYISKIFKEETNESPINYLIKIRLERASEILVEEENESIKNVANRVGYEDVYHFSKLFKKHYGLAPLYYRKREVNK